MQGDSLLGHRGTQPLDLTPGGLQFDLLGTLARTPDGRGTRERVQGALLGSLADLVHRHPADAVLAGRLALGGLAGEHLDEHPVLHRRRQPRIVSPPTN
ncbi:hypothetical protein AB0C27_28320 [Nonomuraea sp. NPDC048882]|uniref:hypothetical protein n=1 Tax=Nonomuraea sp. NPDC048882 TaxID=3154347 RepID=UPI0033F827A4